MQLGQAKVGGGGAHSVSERFGLLQRRHPHVLLRKGIDAPRPGTYETVAEGMKMAATLRLLLVSCLVLMVTGCPADRRRGDVDDPDIPDLDDDDVTDPPVDDDDATDPPDPGPLGFVGSPCDTVADCDFEDAICLTDGFPDGMCSQACELYCPDRAGHPVTFCVDADELPASAPGDGDCLSRCDFGVFPETGCRSDYGCAVAPRANEPGTLKYVCMPNAASELNECHTQLAARGLAFEPTIIAIDHPSGHPELDCDVVDAVYLQSPVFGVDLQYYDGSPDGEVLARCEMAHSIADTIEDVLPYGVVAMRHYGTYNCRVISGSDTLSEHGLGNAIDIYGFEFDDGELWTLVDDWEHDTSSGFDTAAGEWLYDSAYRWFDDDIWNIILTPNYNSAHDDHFHVDLTAGGNYIGYWGGRYIGPAPYAD